MSISDYNPPTDPLDVIHEGMGYVPCHGEKLAEVLDSTYEIDVAGTRVRAEVSSKPFYDPMSERVKV